MRKYTLAFEVDATVVDAKFWFGVTLDLESYDEKTAIDEAYQIMYDQFNPYFSEACEISLIFLERTDVLLKEMKDKADPIKRNLN